MNQINTVKNSIKKEFKNLKKETNGQGAAEYILLFGGVVAIAIAALLIYNQYFKDINNEFNASTDIGKVRNTMNSS